MSEDVGTTPRRPMPQMRRLAIWERHKGVCIICKEKIDAARKREKWTIEHIIPLGLGGADDDKNCGPAHEGCRREKDKADVTRIAKAKRIKIRHLGGKKPSTFRKPPPGYRHDWKRGGLRKET